MMPIFHQKNNILCLTNEPVLVAAVSVGPSRLLPSASGRLAEDSIKSRLHDNRI